MRLILVTFVLLVIFGCAATSPSSVQLENANYGELPTDYQGQVKIWFGHMLKDPYSAQYEFGTPEKAWFKDGILAPSGGAMRYGWLIPFSVNAKNSYGGYVGSQSHTAFYSQGTFTSADAQVNAGYTSVVK